MIVYDLFVTRRRCQQQCHRRRCWRAQTDMSGRALEPKLSAAVVTQAAVSLSGRVYSIRGVWHLVIITRCHHHGLVVVNIIKLYHWRLRAVVLLFASPFPITNYFSWSNIIKYACVLKTTYNRKVVMKVFTAGITSVPILTFQFKGQRSRSFDVKNLTQWRISLLAAAAGRNLCAA